MRRRVGSPSTVKVSASSETASGGCILLRARLTPRASTQGGMHTSSRKSAGAVFLALFRTAAIVGVGIGITEYMN